MSFPSENFFEQLKILLKNKNKLINFKYNFTKIKLI